MLIILDTGPLGMVTNPRGGPEATRCATWLMGILAKGVQVRVAEIADYELRRELLRAGRVEGLSRLDRLKEALGYLPITTDAMLMAAGFWARARNLGRPTADDKAIDADMILSAQAVLAGADDDPTIIATTNVGHLNLFCEARFWSEIQ